MNYTAEQIVFIENATERISDNPVTRLSVLTRETLLRNNFVFDAHCHLFDGDCINVFYLAVRMISGAPVAFKSKVWRIITGSKIPYEKSILSTNELVETLYKNPDQIKHNDNLDAFLAHTENELNKLETEIDNSNIKNISALSYIEFLSRYRQILQLLASNNMADVYEKFRDRYAIHNIVNNAHQANYELITVALGMDLNSGWDGSIKKSNREQNAELGALAQAYPILPFLPIDPRRAEASGEDNLYTFFLNAFDKAHPSFFGVKCYPSLGYLPTDSRLKPIFEICAKKKIPILTHCGGESVSTFANPIIVDRGGISQNIPGISRSTRARFLNEPREWEEVLDNHSGLKLCFGHFGSGSAWENDKDAKAHRISEIIGYMHKYNVYADFAYNLESDIATDNFLKKLIFPDADGAVLRDRTMFGTDFWVVLPISNLNFDQQKFITKLGIMKDSLLKYNVIRFLGLESIFTNNDLKMIL